MLKSPSTKILFLLLIAVSCRVGVAETSPILSSSTDTLDMGQVGVSDSVSADVTFTNDSSNSATLTLTPLTGDFSTSDFTSCATLAAGASCTLTVTYTPSSAGAADQNLIVTTGSETTAVELKGVGVAGHLSASVSDLDLGQTFVGTGSVHADIILTNKSTDTATQLSLTPLTGDFSVTGFSTCATLAALATCTLSVTYAPSLIGAAAAQDLVITSTGDDGLTIPLKGRGLGPIFFSKSAIDLGNVYVSSNGHTTVDLTNNSLSPVVLALTSLTGPFSTSDFSGCATLAAGAACTLTVTFTPTALGDASDTLTVTPTGGTAISIPLTGAGVGPFSASRSTINFGDVVVGQHPTIQTQITNNSTGNLTVTPATIPTGPFTMTANDCTTALVSGASCTLTLKFTPTVEGTITRNLTINAVDANAQTLTPIVVALSGFGIAPITFSETTFDFGQVSQAQASSAHYIVVTNTSQYTASRIEPSLLIDGFYLESDCGATLAGHATCLLTVHFFPILLGEYPAPLTLSYKGRNSATASVVDTLT